MKPTAMVFSNTPMETDMKVKLSIYTLDMQTGDWVHNKRHGKGIFYCQEDSSTYSGEYVDNRRDGFGVLTFASGHLIHGTWRRGTLDSIEKFVISPNSSWRDPDL